MSENRPYSLEVYNSNWVSMFENLKNYLKEVFKDGVLAIEHVGSTSIPGMKAKPIIDVLIVVKEFGLFIKEKNIMREKGYKTEENHLGSNTLLFFKESTSREKKENIHICLHTSERVPEFLAKRDYFRKHPDQASRYSALKEELQRLYPNDYFAYREAKRPFLKEIEEKAYAEWVNPFT